MTDMDKEYLTALTDLAEQINKLCSNDCDKCFQRKLCEVVTAMESYVSGRLKDE